MSGPITADRLRSFVERVERLDEEIKALNQDKSESFKQAKGLGFDVPTLKKVIQARRMDPADRRERDELFGLYMAAIEGPSRTRTREEQDAPVYIRPGAEEAATAPAVVGNASSTSPNQDAPPTGAAEGRHVAPSVDRPSAFNPEPPPVEARADECTPRASAPGGGSDPAPSPAAALGDDVGLSPVTAGDGAEGESMALRHCGLFPSASDQNPHGNGGERGADSHANAASAPFSDLTDEEKNAALEIPAFLKRPLAESVGAAA